MLTLHHDLKEFAKFAQRELEENRVTSYLRLKIKKLFANCVSQIEVEDLARNMMTLDLSPEHKILLAPVIASAAYLAARNYSNGW